MMTNVAKAVEKNLKGLNYPGIESALANVEPEILIELLDSKSIKIGDSAAGLIKGSHTYRVLISSVLENRITTKLGKIRAKSILFRTGRQYPKALEVYLSLLNDSNDEIAYDSLLGLVFWGDKRALPLIKERAKCLKSREDAKEFERACDALERSDPASFKLHFNDVASIWQ